MYRLLFSLGTALLGIFTTGCTGTGGQIKTTIDGVELEADANGRGGVSLTVGTDAGSVTVSGQLGHAPAVLTGKPAAPTTAPTITVDAGK